MLILLALLPVAAWTFLLLFRGRFWAADQRLPPARHDGPHVIAVVPARDEADVIGGCIAGLLAQTHQPPIRVILVDDGSSDGTADRARAADDGTGRLEIIGGAPRPPGWTGKLWAVSQGVARASAAGPDYIWLSDADIHHGADVGASLVAKAEAEGRVLTSLMVRLHCRSAIEKLGIPAFVFFFQKLYPFPWANDPRRRMAAAAGGCMLVKRSALEAAGGIASIRGDLIDDCALARRLKPHGPIWLGLAEASASLRPYTFADLWKMVARSAFHQLHYSALLLAGTVLGMVLLYLLAPGLLVWGMASGQGLIALLGGLGCALMATAYWPTVRYYGLAPPWALCVPLAGTLYTLMTLDSARRHWLGRGGEWKGRVQGGVEGGLADKEGSA
ncbi:glycosyltransferase [Zavarzinia sp. CC-PAN008]|uniref:glycosyltransferase n=1 Tax=Zavarzinia sp. CC-PAN008 TaxID=3243332 RepID=UPI003F7460D7